MTEFGIYIFIKLDWEKSKELLSKYAFASCT